MNIKNLLPLLTLALFSACNNSNKQNVTSTENPSAYERVSPDFSGDSAFAYVAEQCKFGPRTMNSEAHEQCAEWIIKKFRSFGCNVTDQHCNSKLYDGTPVKMRNIIASFNTEAPTRILICSHWDSRPWADNDDNDANHHTAIDGANDGASGVGVMMELARLLQPATNNNDSIETISGFFATHPNIGIDFACWDAEDCGVPQFDNDYEGEHDKTWCLGSAYWAEHTHREGYHASCAILLDMVGGEGTVFRREGYSVRYAQNLTDRVWSMASMLGYGNIFLNEDGGYVTDDHLQVMRAGIACIDIIGNDAKKGGFPSTWHTVNDNIHNISPKTLTAVGQTLLELIWLMKSE